MARRDAAADRYACFERQVDVALLDESDRTSDAGGEQLMSTIAALDERLPNEYVITLENGQTWRQMRAQRYPHRGSCIAARSCGTQCTMTKRTKTKTRVRSPLTDLENEVMRAVWHGGRCSVEAVHRIVARKRDLKETTVRTLLRRLEQKGYLEHESEGRAYVYRAVEPASKLAARAVRQIIDRFCQGSVEELVSGMVDAKMLTDEEIERLEQYVRRRRRKEP